MDPQRYIDLYEGLNIGASETLKYVPLGMWVYFIRYKTMHKLYIKGALLGLRQSLTSKSPLKVMKSVFYFTFFISLNFKFCDVTAWLTNNWNTHIAQYL